MRMSLKVSINKSIYLQMMIINLLSRECKKTFVAFYNNQHNQVSRVKTLFLIDKTTEIILYRSVMLDVFYYTNNRVLIG